MTALLKSSIRVPMQAGLLLLLLPAAALAATRNVDRANVSCNDVTGTPYCTVQAAVNASGAGDIIVIAAGSYIEQITLDRNVILRGAGASAVSGTCDGLTNILGASPITVLAGVVATVQSVTVKGSFNTQGGGVFNAGTLALVASEVCANLAAAQGGGIYTSGRLVLSDVAVYDNTQSIPGADGGGLFVAGGGVAIVNNSSFWGNRVSRGGAISVADGGRLLLTDVTLTANVADNTNLSLLAGWGGAIYNDGIAILDRTRIGSRFDGNVVLDTNGQGGGIYNAGSLLVTKSAIIGNAIDSAGAPTGSAFGAGLYNASEGTASVVSSTVSGNLYNILQIGYGAGIANDGVLTLNNVTITDNANGGAAGIASGAGVSALGGSVTVRNSIIVSQRTGTDCSGAITTDGYNLDSDASCGLIAAAAGGTDVPAVADPGLLPLAENGGPTMTHALTEDSVAIDMGNPAGCRADLTGSGAANVLLAGDQRGNLFVDVPGAGGDPSGCDVGAYEFNLLFNAMMEDDDDGDRIPDGWTGASLQGADRRFCRPRQAHSGLCYFQLRGSNNRTKQLTQELERSGAAGDSYTLRVFISGLNVTGNPIVRLQFDDLQTFGVEEEFVLPLPLGTYDYAEQILSVTTTSAIGYTVVRVIVEDGAGGTLAIDDVSLVPHP